MLCLQVDCAWCVASHDRQSPHFYALCDAPFQTLALPARVFFMFRMNGTSRAHMFRMNGTPRAQERKSGACQVGTTFSKSDASQVGTMLSKNSTTQEQLPKSGAPQVGTISRQSNSQPLLI